MVASNFDRLNNNIPTMKTTSRKQPVIGIGGIKRIKSGLRIYSSYQRKLNYVQTFVIKYIQYSGRLGNQKWLLRVINVLKTCSKISYPHFKV